MFYLLKSLKKIFFNRKFLIIFFVFLNLKIYPIQDISDFSKVATEEEALFLRRVIEFWEEGERTLVKKEIESYLKKTKTPFFDYLYALLGDIYLSEDNSKKASENYFKIGKKEVKEKVFINFIQALYDIEKYEKLCLECEDFSDFIESRDRNLNLRFSYLIGDSYYKRALLSEKNKKLELAKKAKKYFSRFIDTSYENRIIESLADLSTLLKEYEAADKLYLKLSKNDEKRRGDFLFKAACLQAKYDKEKALETFSRICHIGRGKAREAAMNKLILLMESKRYSDLILAKDQLEKLLKNKQKHLFNFFVAKSFFMLKDYKRAVPFIKSFLEKEDGGEKARYILDIGVVCAEKLEEESLFDYLIEKHEKLFKENPDLVKLYFARAVFHKNKKNYQKAKKDFLYVEEKFSNFSDPIYLFEMANFYYKTSNFLKSRSKFKEFIENYKDHELISDSWRYFINSSIKMTKKVPKEGEVNAKNELIKDLEDFLAVENVTKKEKIEVLILLAQTKYEIENYKEALLDIKTLFENYKDMEKNANANLLLALCYQKNGFFEKFYDFAEKALSLDMENSLDEKNIRINLFNAYLQSSYKENSKAFIKKAAEHLFRAMTLNDEGILLNNMLWLGDFYYYKVEKYVKANWKNKLENNKKIEDLCKRAIFVLEKVKNLKEAPLANLKLATLFGYKGEIALQKEILESLKEKNFLRERVLFDLGRVYVELNEMENANNCFKEIIALNKRSYYQMAADLYLSRLKIQEIERDKLNLNNREVVKILSVLKNLKLQKNLKNEPIHLEAALDYVDIQFLIDKNEEKKLKLLLQVKEDFSSNEDIISKDYQNSKKLYPAKEKLLNAYLLLIDAKINLCRTKLGEKKVISKVKNICNYLNDNNLVVSKYLEEEMEKLFLEVKNYGK
jgi:tetratricopeptide (TPR) repeat protein